MWLSGIVEGASSHVESHGLRPSTTRKVSQAKREVEKREQESTYVHKRVVGTQEKLFFFFNLRQGLIM